MPAFAIGTVIALLLTAGAAYFYTISNVMMVQRSSPAQSVRVEEDASGTAQGTGYGTPRRVSQDQPTEEETARR